MSPQGRITRRVAALAAPLAITAALLVPAAANAYDFPLKAWWPLAEGKGQTVKDWSSRATTAISAPRRASTPTIRPWVKGVLGSAPRCASTASTTSSPSRTRPSLQPAAADRVAVVPRRRLARVVQVPAGPRRRRLRRPRPTASRPTSTAASRSTSGTAPTSASPGWPMQSVWDGKWHHAAGTWDGTNAQPVHRRQGAAGTAPNVPTTIDYTGPTGPTYLGGYHAGCDLLVHRRPRPGDDLVHAAARGRHLGQAVGAVQPPRHFLEA